MRKKRFDEFKGGKNQEWVALAVFDTSTADIFGSVFVSTGDGNHGYLGIIGIYPDRRNEGYSKSAINYAPCRLMKNKKQKYGSLACAHYRDLNDVVRSLLRQFFTPPLAL